MYMPQAFRESDTAVLHDFMRQYSFATLITRHDDAPFASHLPFVFEADDGPHGTLVAHMARANPQWRHFDDGRQVLVLFQGPHAYVSPSWYGVHPSVPTWNYATVHAYGTPQVIHDCTELLDVLRTLVHTYEAPRPQPWAFDLPEAYLDGMLRGIVGFRIRLTRVEGKYKLSQNRPEADQQRVVQALQAQGDALSTEVARLMQSRGIGANVAAAK